MEGEARGIVRERARADATYVLRVGNEVCWACR
jgi:hypothetical protein